MDDKVLINIILNLVENAENLYETLEGEGLYAEYEEQIDSLRASVNFAMDTIEEHKDIK